MLKKILWVGCFVPLILLNNAWTQNNIMSDIKALADNGQSFDARRTGITRRWNELRPAFGGNDSVSHHLKSPTPQVN
ncbi:MAG: hypothetical protein LBT14_05750 [Treponema sp.]|jgi:hypothetical protein|nr:hypothetical protein [Treponema sp.]